MEKTKEQLINDYKKANKERKQKIAEKAGFKTGTDYLNSLIKTAKIKVNKTSKMKGIFYVIDLLDATGSMDGGKYENSKKGIIDGIKDMSVRKDIKYSLIEFIDSGRELYTAISQQLPKDVNTSDIRFSGAIGGDTPLYHSVCEVISNISVKPEDKVLINVYTDGGDNGPYSNRETTKKAANLIAKVQKENFTVTFVATPGDLERIKRDINIDDSNTLATANTAEGFKMSMQKTRSAKMSYFANTEAGMDTLVGFYKKGGKL